MDNMYQLSMSITNPTDNGLLSVTDLDFNGLMQLNGELSHPVKNFNSYDCTIYELDKFLNRFGLECLIDNIIKDDGYMFIEAYPYIRIYINKYMKKETHFYSSENIQTYSVFNVCNKCICNNPELLTNHKNTAHRHINIMSILNKDKYFLCHSCACKSKRFKEDRMFRELVLGSDFPVYITKKYYEED